MGVRIATWLGVIGILVGIALLLLMPKPTAKDALVKQREQERNIQANAARTEKDFEVAKAKVASETWSGGTQGVGPGALAAINKLATKYRVQLSGFRPERPSQASGLDLLPYSVTATGAFLDVLNFVKAIENPDNKLAVDSLQIASSEANSDQVIATIGLNAYLVTEAPKHA